MLKNKGNKTSDGRTAVFSPGNNVSRGMFSIEKTSIETGKWILYQ
jgi:hypothetical protein